MSTPLARLAGRISAHLGEPLPAEVRQAARRTLFNVLATSIGAAREPAVDIVVAACADFGAGEAVVPGRAERLRPGDAALATGIAAHLDDYDDTHLATVIHPGAVCLSTLVALQEEIGEFGSEAVLTAFAWGVEAQLRLGVSVSPEHYDAGWHITGTCGAVGAAVTAAVLLGLDEDRLRVALEWAVEGGLGNRQGFGTMAKPFHPGKAAVRGLRAARSAAAGVAGPGDALTGPDGFAARLAGGKFDAEALLGAAGSRWELLANTFKPYPCGIVSHPAIEAAEALHVELAERGGADAVTAIRLLCHPLVPELTGTIQPDDGLQARFSTAHGIAAGLLTPKVGLGGYGTELVVSEPARRLRSLVTFDARTECRRDAASLEIVLADGGVLRQGVTHARGSLARPFTDEELVVKAAGLVDHILPGGATALDAATRHRGTGYVQRLLAACAPNSEHSAPPAPVQGEGGAGGEDHALARFLAEGGESTGGFDDLVANAARRWADSMIDDMRERAGDVAAGLGQEGPVSAAAAAAAVSTGAAGSDAARAVSTALAVTGRLAARLDVPVGRLTVLAATAAATVSGGLPPRAALMALGLAATQTTTVAGDAGTPEVEVERFRHATADGVEAAVLARHGFTAAEHPLTGRRGLLSLMAVRAEPPLV